VKSLWLGSRLLAGALGLSLASLIACAVESTASTQGACSQAFSQVVVLGNLTINANCADYREVLQPIADKLSAFQREKGLSDSQMKATVEASNIMISAVLKQMGGVVTTLHENNKRLRNLEKVIDKRLPKPNSAPEVIVTDAQQWKVRYDNLLEQWGQVPSEGEQDEQARQALQDLDLDNAGRVLDHLIEQSGQTEKVAAMRQYRRAEVFRLQSQQLDALPHYEKAYALDPANLENASAYALVLIGQRDYNAAERVYGALLPTFRNLVAQDPVVYRPDLAITLNNLGIIYDATQRLNLAEAAYAEASDIERMLAHESPAAYRPALAEVLDNLGVLYVKMQRFQAAETAYREAWKVYRELARNDPETYSPALATTLTNLGGLYDETQRFDAAKAAYDEALEILRKIARGNPALYRPDLALTLNNLGNLYDDMQRTREAEAALKEALDIRRELARDNPAAYRPDLTATLNDLGTLNARVRRFQEAEAAYREARDIERALAHENPEAYRPALAMTLTNLGALYTETQHFKEAEGAYLESRNIRRILASNTPASYQPALAVTLNNLALLYRTERRFAEAEAVEREVKALAPK
jgi:tetratricopeptide (TPR) repeat protein